MRALIAFCCSLFVAFSPECIAETLTTATGYKLEYSVHGKGASGPIALIIMHGKDFPPERVKAPSPLSDQIAEHGFTVYRPIMPWSKRWDGTHEDATSAIDALVDLAIKDGKKVIVGGHSMGAMFAAIYRSSNLPSGVIGKFLSAPGHMLDLMGSTSNFWNEINPSISRAKALEAEGKGKEKTQFSGSNTTGSQNVTESYEMTPEVYLSFHDPKRLPSISNALKTMPIPVLWTVGNNDPLSRNNAGKSTFDMIPSNPKSIYVLLEGKNHSTSFAASISHLIPWMKSLVAQ